MRNIADLHIHMHNYEEADGIRLFDQLYDSGVTEAVIMALPKYSTLENLSALRWKLHPYKLKLRAFGGLHQFDKFGDILPEVQAEKLLDMGFDGMKVLDMKPDFRKRVGRGLNDPYYAKMFGMLEERDVPVLLHVNDPEEFWDPDKVAPSAKERGWFYGDGSYASLKELYAIAEKIMARHPKLKACFAHLYFCGDDRKHAEWLLDTYENTYLDITPGTEMYEWFAKDLPGWKAFFERYQDRIMLGSDDAANTRISDHGTYALALSALGKGEMDYYGTPYGPALGLEEEVAEKITYHNFRAFAGEEPKPLNM